MSGSYFLDSSTTLSKASGLGGMVTVSIICFSTGVTLIDMLDTQ